MPRKAFIADVAAAASKSPAGVTNVSRGAEDGEVNFQYIIEGESAIGIRLIATGTYQRRAVIIYFSCKTSICAQILASP